MHNGMLQYGFGAQSAAFLPFAGGKSAPSLTSLHIVETNQEISVKNCSTPESCRYIIKSWSSLELCFLLLSLLCMLFLYTITLWFQVLMLNADSMYVDSSYTVSLHGNRNSSKSHITLHMMWVYNHHTIFMECFTSQVCKSIIMSVEDSCKEPCHLALSICEL